MAESPFSASASYSFDSIPKPSVSSSTATSSTSSVTEQWRQIQSYHAAKRQQMQAERLKQLQDLERQVTDVASWTQQRTELVTTPIRRTLSKDDDRSFHSITNDDRPEQINSARSSISLTNESRCTRYDSVKSHTRQDSHLTVDDISANGKKVDLNDATLEDLQGLIAASAQRLATFRLQTSMDGSRRRTQSSNAVDNVRTSPNGFLNRTKQEDLNRLKNIFDGRRTRDGDSYYSDQPHRHSMDTVDTSQLSKEVGTANDSCDDLDASFVTTFTTLSDDREIDTNHITARTGNATEQLHMERTGLEKERKSIDTTSDKESLHLLSPSSPSLSVRMSSRSELEKTIAGLDSEGTELLNSSITSPDNINHVNESKTSGGSFFVSKDGSQSNDSSPKPSSSSHMLLSKSLPRASSYSRQLTKEPKQKPKRRPVDLAILDTNNLRTRANGSQSLDSPESATKLPTPKSGHTSSGTFPRTSFPSPQLSARQRLRTLSSIDRSEAIPRWGDNEVKLGHTGITSTRSTFANATPKIDHPRLSTSTTPHRPRLKLSIADRKQTNSNPARKLSSPILTSSRALETEKEEADNPCRSRKMSLVKPSTQKSQSIRSSRDSTNTSPIRTRKVSILTSDQTKRTVAESDRASVRGSGLEDARMHKEEVNPRIEPPKLKTSTSSRRRVLSVHHANSDKKGTEGSTASQVRLMPPSPQTPKTLCGDSGKPVAATKSPSKRTTGRKRGKTLPGNLASPPAVAPLALPPMKVEPLNLTIPQGRAEISSKTPSRSTARTPTRIPLPVQKASRQCKQEAESFSTGSSEDELLATPEKERLQNVSATQAKKAVKDNYLTVGTPKVGLTTTVFSGAISGVNGTTSGRPADTKASVSTSSRKSKTTTVSPIVSRSNRTTNVLPRSRKISTTSAKLTASSSAKTTSSTSELHEPDPNRRKITKLHGRLPDLVDDSNVRSSQAEQDKGGRGHAERKATEVVVLRGGGSSSTSTAAGAREGSAKLDVNHDATLWQKPKERPIRIAVSPQAALKLYQASLSPYEKTELLNYSHIYFTGNHSKKRQATMEQTACNHGYDDDRGDYHIVLRDHLDYRYEVLDVLGKGSFGQVLKCFDHKEGKTVAVKVIRNKKRFHAQALVEVKILEDLILWDPEDKHNNIRMLEHFYFRNHLCIAFECLSINLYDFIKSNNFQGFSMGLIRRFTVQMLNSLSLLRKHKLIHCDLKPENILLKHPAKSTIKIIDFGSSCLENEKVYTYIQSRFYRSPEVILGMNYGMAIDMWSIGCILAELYTGTPLFPGENEQEQLACIMEIQGVPNPHLVQKNSLGNPRIMPNSQGKKRRPGTRKLSDALKSTDENFIDFVNQCLNWDPEKRLTPDEAFQHPWITGSSRRHHTRM
ncbi:hypothetical protein EC973_006356 [Apophysomyces ossiformis]|uniref:dual-specificity kinase n=1 Tax=Apophysomyces ossiformis TaxID=679940 RepID=A0A8H7C0Q9_9FUNG|nr:hypothetical protein EC973_006356 [Apophysomyces ossiformis]